MGTLVIPSVADGGTVTAATWNGAMNAIKAFLNPPSPSFQPENLNGNKAAQSLTLSWALAAGVAVTKKVGFKVPTGKTWTFVSAQLSVYGLTANGMVASFKTNTVGNFGGTPANILTAGTMGASADGVTEDTVFSVASVTGGNYLEIWLTTSNPAPTWTANIGEATATLLFKEQIA